MYAPLTSYGRIIRTIPRPYTEELPSINITDRGYVLKIFTNPVEDGLAPHMEAISEAVAMQNIKSKYTIPLVDIELGKETTTLVMPLAKSSLDQGITGLDKKQIITQLCLGLADIHNSNFLHLDLKPENIFISPTGTVWIADFGLSMPHLQVRAMPNSGVYTLGYIPPEVISGDAITEKADVWALGVVIAEILLSTRRRRRLFSWKSEEEYIHSRDKLLQNPNPILKGIPNFVLRMLDPNPLTRPSIFQVLSDPYFGKVEIPICISSHDRLITYANYPENKWKDWRDREKVVRWLFQLANRYQVSNSSLGLGIYLVDTIVGLLKIRKDNLSLYAGLCLYLSDNYLTCPGNLCLTDLKLELADVYSLEKLCSGITEILQGTNFGLAAVTAYDFMNLYTDRTISPIEDRIWQKAVFTTRYFDFPEKVAETILILSQEDVIDRVDMMRKEIKAL